MRLNIYNQFRSETGVATIEFAIIGFVVFGLIGVIFDLGLGWFRYSNLTNTVAMAARTTSQDLFKSRGKSCAAVSAQAVDTANTIYRQRYSFGNPAFTAEFPAVVPRVIRVSGTVPLDCLFCNLLPANFTLSAQADSMIEHGGCSCTP